MARKTPLLRTPGVIADELGEPLNRILYILRSRAHIIKPIGRAGVLRLYDSAAVEVVRNFLAANPTRQGGRQ